MYTQLNEYSTITKDDEVLVVKSYDFDKGAFHQPLSYSWESVPGEWCGWTPHFLQKRMEDMGLLGNIIIRRKSKD